MEDEMFEEMYDEYDMYDEGMTFRERCYSDRNDYANERLANGEIDEEQAAELRAGA